MRKTILLLMLLSSFALVSRAQAPAVEATSATPPALLSMGIDVGTTLSPTSNTYSSAAGISFKLELPFKDLRSYLTISAAYSSYSVKNTPATDTLQNGHYIPLMIGYKYFITKQIFLEGDIGDSFNINQSYMGYQNAFAFQPMVGVSIPLNKPNTAVDIALYYQSRLSDAGNINQAAIRVAYKFGL